jgi:predicted nucleic acid-binding protein
MFANRVLSFDMACTKADAELLAKSRAAGLAVELADALIAAVALANGFAVATRDINPFVAAGVNVINPWEASP